MGVGPKIRHPAAMLHNWSAQKESCWDVRSFKELNTISENIYPNIMVESIVISFLMILKKLIFIFQISGIHCRKF